MTKAIGSSLRCVANGIHDTIELSKSFQLTTTAIGCLLLASKMYQRVYTDFGNIERKTYTENIRR